MSLRMKWFYDQSMKTRRLRRYSHMSAMFISESIIQPSLTDQILSASKPFVFKCSLCGRDRSICPAEECMPWRLQLEEDIKYENAYSNFIGLLTKPLTKKVDEATIPS